MQRQIPQEVLFKSDSLSTRRDPVKKNRYHFKFPNNWITSAHKEPIVGIRSLYIVPSYKFALISIRAAVYAHDYTTPDWHILSETETIISAGKFMDDNMRLYDFVNQIYINMEEQFKPNIKNERKARFLRCFYQYNAINELEHECQFIIKSDYNDLSEDDRTEEVTINDITFDRSYLIDFEIEEINEGARTLLHFNVDAAGKVIDSRVNTTKPIITHGLYDYNQCVLHSNLAYMDEDSFLGHTRHYGINPIKYYELKNNNQSFWVDLYAANDHKTAIELNKDDALYIEAQLLMTNEAIL